MPANIQPITTTMPGDGLPSLPEIWREKATGLEWCDCGCHHPLTKTIVTEFARDVLGLHLPKWVTHRQVILIAMQVWNYISVCRFFTMAIEDAAVRVNGCVAPVYSLEIGLAIVKAFSDRWNGCPTENCDDEWTADDIHNPSFTI